MGCCLAMTMGWRWDLHWELRMVPNLVKSWESTKARR